MLQDSRGNLVLLPGGKVVDLLAGLEEEEARHTLQPSADEQPILTQRHKEIPALCQLIGTTYSMLCAETWEDMLPCHQDKSENVLPLDHWEHHHVQRNR